MTSLSRLVVEAVRDLVPDDGSDGAEVDGRVDVGVEEGRLKDSRREHNLVEHGVIVRVHLAAGSSTPAHPLVRSSHPLVRSFIGFIRSSERLKTRGGVSASVEA